MFNKIKKIMRKDKGFTLIELVVVVVIIGILALALIPSVIGRVQAAKESRYDSDVDAIATAARMYYLDNDGWPSGIGDLDSYGIEASSKDPWEDPYTISSTEGNLIIKGGEGTEAKTIKAPVTVPDNEG